MIGRLSRIPAALRQLRHREQLSVLGHNAQQLLIAIDQAVNALGGVLLALLRLLHIWPWPVGKWWGDETISAHCWRWHQDGVRSWPMWIIDALALIFADSNHCQKSYGSERHGRQLPPEYRNDNLQHK